MGSAESLCSPLYPVANAALYQEENRSGFGTLVALHFFLAAIYAFHLFVRWSSDYSKIVGVSDTTAPCPPPPPPTKLIVTIVELQASTLDDGPNASASCLEQPSGGVRNSAAEISIPQIQVRETRTPFFARIHKKLFLFSVANFASNILLGTSWLFWVLGNLSISDIESNDVQTLIESIRYQSVFYALFPLGILCFLVALFAFSDRFVALCIRQKNDRPFVRLISWRWLWLLIILFLAIAVSGIYTLVVQVQVGEFQERCFNDPSFPSKLTSLSSGVLFSFDFNCSFPNATITPGEAACSACNSGVCALQQVGHRTFSTFLFVYLLAVVTGLVAALRIWASVSRQLLAYMRSISEILRWRTVGRQSFGPANAFAHNARAIWSGLTLILFAFLQRFAVLLVLVSNFTADAPCNDQFISVCSPCDPRCRPTAEVLSNWMLLDPHVLSFSSVAAEFGVSLIMAAIQFWLVSKSREGNASRDIGWGLRGLRRSEQPLDSNDALSRKKEGADFAFAIALQHRDGAKLSQ
jgi:hypothetical protein